MNTLGLTLHHLGLACRDEIAATAFLSALGYDVGESVYEAAHKVQVCYCRHQSMPDVEVLTQGEEESPIQAYLQQHAALVYHICYECDGIELTLAKMTKADINHILISDSAPSLTLNRKHVAFVFVNGIGLIELITPEEL